MFPLFPLLLQQPLPLLHLLLPPPQGLSLPLRLGQELRLGWERGSITPGLAATPVLLEDPSAFSAPSWGPSGLPSPSQDPPDLSIPSQGSLCPLPVSHNPPLVSLCPSSDPSAFPVPSQSLSAPSWGSIRPPHVPSLGCLPCILPSTPTFPAPSYDPSQCSLALPASSGAPLYPQVSQSSLFSPGVPHAVSLQTSRPPAKGRSSCCCSYLGFCLLFCLLLCQQLLQGQWLGLEVRPDISTTPRNVNQSGTIPQGPGSPWSTIPIQALSTLSSLSPSSGHSPPLPLLSVHPDPSETWSPSPCPGTNFQGKQHGIRHSSGGSPTSRGFRGQQEPLKKVTGPTWIASCPYPAGAHPCPCPDPSCCGHGPAPCAADP